MRRKNAVRLVGRALAAGLLLVSARSALADLRGALREAPALVRIPPGALGPGYRNAVDALVKASARTIPLPASTASFTYRYDPETGRYERTSETFGPMLFMERPETLGQGTWSAGVTGQYLERDEFDGHGIGRDPFPVIIPGSGAAVLLVTPKFVNHLAAVNVTYGIRDDLDLNVAVPVLTSDNDVNATLARGTRSGFNTEHSKVSLGVGDVRLRAKYRVFEWQGLTGAAGAVLRLPTGEEDDGLGTGDVELGPTLALAKRWGERVETHWNAGFEFDLENSNESAAHYAFGVNVQAIKDRIDLGVSFLGRSEVDGLRSDAAISGPHQTPAGPALTPYGGYDFGRKDMFDFHGGAKLRLYRTLVLTLSALKPLNEDGLRSSTWSPVGGLEATF
jgi:hypothetical protein